jgi:hypothetical protein
MAEVDATYSPAERIGLVAVTDKGVYRAADVKDVARQMWVLDAGSGQLINVIESVVTLPAAADARHSSRSSPSSGSVVMAPR